ncbi:hypothetical protein ACRAWF_23055 [Streptomyces sp. L7]
MSTRVHARCRGYAAPPHEQVVAGEGFPDGVPDTTTMWRSGRPGAHRRTRPLGRRHAGR